jgi:transposase
MYCNYKEQAEQTVSNLVASLLKQMVQNRSAISDDVKSFWEHHQRQNARPTLDQVADALKSEIKTYSKVFIVVDALDECREDDATRAKLLKVLRSLGGNVNLMVTSRDLPSIARDFEETKSLYIHAKDQDIRIYLEGRIAVAPRHLKRLQETIVNRIVKKASGM